MLNSLLKTEKKIVLINNKKSYESKSVRGKDKYTLKVIYYKANMKVERQN